MKDRKQETVRQGTSVKALCIALLAACLTIGWTAAPASAWWDGKWQYRKKIQLDASTGGADIKESLADVPVLVRLHTGNFSFGNAKPDGTDLRFVGADDKTLLKHHVEKFDPKEEIALVWVKAPRIAGGAQDSIYMYYGNSSAPDAQDAGGTFDVNQAVVYHFGEKDGSPRDATAYGNHASGFSGKLGLPAVVGNGVQLGGAGDQIAIAKSPSLTFEKGLTFSAWVRLNQTGNNGHLFSWTDGKQSVVIGLDNARIYCTIGQGSGATTTPMTAALVPKRWQHAAVTVDPNNRITVYLDGNEAISTKLKGPIPSPGASIVIGSAAKGTNAFIGDLDEVEISNVSRPPGWFRAAVHGQGPDGKLMALLEEESGGGGSESLTIHLMKVIIRTITLDGWLVIGVCVLLGCGATVVFVQKMIYVRQMRKGNAAFAEAFRLADDPLSLKDREEEFGTASLFRIYKAGCEEMEIRLARGGIKARILGAVQAALDKAALFESRKLAAGMAILNMCVAGGPFLGLFGTVWGVMNTFAGLAESGEANLTAIAPGVASALACTLTGLLIAIPALFAASYISGLIKDLSADAGMFIDEFNIRTGGEEK